MKEEEKKPMETLISDISALRLKVAELEARLAARLISDESLQRTQFAVDRAREAIFIVEFDASIAYVNDAACRSLGYTRDELLSLTVFDIDPVFPVDQREELWISNRGVDSYLFETVHRTKDGINFDVEIAANPIVFGGKEYRVTYARDITERKKTEKMMKQLSTAVEQFSDWILITDIAGTIEYVNYAVELITGYKREDILGKTPRILKSGVYDTTFYKNMCVNGGRSSFLSSYPLHNATDKKEDLTPYDGSSSEVIPLSVVQ